MKSVQLHDKTFTPFIPYEKISEAIDKVAREINNDFRDSEEPPVILCILNGAIMFTAELMKRLEFNCELISLKLSSYEGTSTTGKIREIMGFTAPVRDKRVIVCEDIIDTGNTISHIADMLVDRGATEVRICSLLLKPDVYRKHITLDYIGIEIPNRFIVGFGLDYNELGRNLKDIYVLEEKPAMKYYILFGPPGAGKGTQAGAMVEKHNLCHISTGELLRNEIAAGTALGKKASALINAGELVPDEVVEAMIESKFDSVKDVNGFLLDGFPRTVAQAEALDKMLASRGETVTSVVSIMIPDKMIHERIRHRAEIEGRADDARDEVVSNRIRTYHEKTEPLIDFYSAAGKYNEIDGTGTIDEVCERILDLMSNV